VDDADVLNALSEANHPLSEKELSRRLGARGRAHQALKKSLQRLEKRGEVAAVKGGRYMPARRKQAQEKKRRPARAETGKAGGGDIRGRLVAHRDGYGFVIPDKPIPGIEGDVFIPPGAVGEAMHGDRVRAQLVQGRRRGGGRMEGRIVGVDRRAHPTIVGRFHCGSNYNFVDPYEERILRDIIIPRGAERPPGRAGKVSAKELDGAVVNVEITDYPRSSSSLAKGRVTEVLGRPGDFGLDVEVIIRKYHIPFEFPEEVLTRRSWSIARTSAACPSSPSTAKTPRTSTTPSTSRSAPTATTSSRFTSLMSLIMFAPARSSTARRACVAPRSTFPTVPCPCCRWNSPTASVRSIPRSIEAYFIRSSA
jgi:ribonuclease R